MVRNRLAHNQPSSSTPEGWALLPSTAPPSVPCLWHAVSFWHRAPLLTADKQVARVGATARSCLLANRHAATSRGLPSQQPITTLIKPKSPSFHKSEMPGDLRGDGQWEGAGCASRARVFLKATGEPRRDRKMDGFVSGVERPYCTGSSTPLARFRILYSTLNVRCLGPLGGFEKLWTAGPWPVEHVGGRGRQETAAGRGPLGALSMSISARSGATVGQLP